MKKLLAVLFFFAVFGTVMTAQVGLSFGAGVNHNKTTVGYKFGKIMPYLGFEALKGKASFEVKDEFDSYGGSVSVSLFMPNIGVKYFAIEKESIKAGANLGFYMPLLSGKAISEGEEIKEFGEYFDNFSSYGVEFGFFSEYYFAPQFSIGGEFGYRLLGFKATNPENSNDFVEFTLSGTYTVFSLNYYF